MSLSVAVFACSGGGDDDDSDGPSAFTPGKRPARGDTAVLLEAGKEGLEGDARIGAVAVGDDGVVYASVYRTGPADEFYGAEGKSGRVVALPPKGPARVVAEGVLPTTLAFGGGRLYVVDVAAASLFAIAPGSGRVLVAQFEPDDEVLSPGPFEIGFPPLQLAFDPHGGALFITAKRHIVRVGEGTAVEHVAGSPVGQPPEFVPDGDVNLTGTPFRDVTGVAAHPATGEIWITDFDSLRAAHTSGITARTVARALDSEAIAPWAGPAAGTAFEPSPAPPPLRLGFQPGRLAFAPNGELFVASADGSELYHFTGASADLIHSDKPADVRDYGTPGFAVDSDGNLFVRSGDARKLIMRAAPLAAIEKAAS